MAVASNRARLVHEVISRNREVKIASLSLFGHSYTWFLSQNISVLTQLHGLSINFHWSGCIGVGYLAILIMLYIFPSVMKVDSDTLK